MAKSKKKQKTFPTELVVYVIKEGELRYFSAVRDVEELPEEEAGEIVGVYALTKLRRFKTKRELV